jgi:hypothetical protein
MGESMHRVTVGGTPECVSWRVRIVDRTSVRLRVETGRDAMERTVPVRLPSPPATRVVRGRRIEVPEGESPLDLVLRVAPKGSPLSKVLEALRYLNDYPHG